MNYLRKIALEIFAFLEILKRNRPDQTRLELTQPNLTQPNPSPDSSVVLGGVDQHFGKASFIVTGCLRGTNRYQTSVVAITRRQCRQLGG